MSICPRVILDEYARILAWLKFSLLKFPTTTFPVRLSRSSLIGAISSAESSRLAVTTSCGQFQKSKGNTSEKESESA